jgi:YkoY family integral membrane protein
MTPLEIIAVVLALIVLEGLLSADNAIVLAVLVRPLPKRLQRKALLYGLVGGYVMRGLMLLFITLVAGLWWVELAGGAYLVYLAVRHVVHLRRPDIVDHVHGPDEDEDEPGLLARRPQPGTAPSFWRTVATVELMDLAFAVDSALVAVALTRVLWVMYIGVFIGILMLRLAAGWFVGVMERYPRFEHVAYGLVAWAGLKLLIEGEAGLSRWLGHDAWSLHLPKPAFWAVTFLVLLLGSLWALRRTRPVRVGLEPGSDG